MSVVIIAHIVYICACAHTFDVFFMHRNECRASDPRAFHEELFSERIRYDDCFVYITAFETMKLLFAFNLHTTGEVLSATVELPMQNLNSSISGDWVA